MIQMTIDGAHKAGKWVGICGELGADLEMTETFLALGVDELSVTPRAVLPLRNAVRNADISQSGEKLIAALMDDHTHHL